MTLRLKPRMLRPIRHIGPLKTFMELINEEDEHPVATFASEPFDPERHENLDVLFATASRTALSIFECGIGPAFILAVAKASNGDLNVLFITTQWRSDEEKIEFCAGLRGLFVHSGVQRYCVAQEAWAALYAAHDVDPREVPPSERSNREDIMFVLGVDVSGEKKIVRQRTWTVDPGEAGVRPASIIGERIEPEERISESGRMVELADGV